MPKTIYDKRYRKIIELLVKERLKKSMTQNELSKLTNISIPNISKIENLERRLDVLEFFDLLIALNVDIHDFFNTLLKNIFLDKGNDEKV